MRPDWLVHFSTSDAGLARLISRSALRESLRRLMMVWIAVGVVLTVPACGPSNSSEDAEAPENALALDVDTVLTDTTYTLVNQDNQGVRVPDDFVGKPMLVGAIFTNCPNVCPEITANMKEVRNQLASPDSVQFISVTFDPHRDTPSRLATYRQRFDLEETSWQFLTGDPASIEAFLDHIDVVWRIQGTDRKFPADTTEEYIYTHSNQITLIDAQGRVRAEYGGSQTPPSLILRDLQEIQS